MLQRWLTSFFDALPALILGVALLALICSALLVLAGWRHRSLLRTRNVVESGDVESRPSESGILDLCQATTTVLRRVEPMAQQQLVTIERALQPDLSVRSETGIFQDILTDLIERAISRSPCGRVLLMAERSGNRVVITVSDDGVAIDPATETMRLEDAESLVAALGIAVAVESQVGRGTTITMRLPAGVMAGPLRVGAPRTAEVVANLRVERRGSRIAR